jgi:hypothetical protein
MGVRDFLMVLALAMLANGCSTTEAARPGAPEPPAGVEIESAVFPVVFTSGGFIGPVICRNPAELRARRDFEVEKLEREYQVIDSAGTVFRPRRVRVMRKAPGMLARLFDGTFYTSAGVRVDFALAPEGRMTSAEFWKAMMDGDRDPRPCGGRRGMALPDLLRKLAAAECGYWH